MHGMLLDRVPFEAAEFLLRQVSAPAFDAGRLPGALRAMAAAELPPGLRGSHRAAVFSPRNLDFQQAIVCGGARQLGELSRAERFAFAAHAVEESRLLVDIARAIDIAAPRRIEFECRHLARGGDVCARFVAALQEIDIDCDPGLLQ